MVLLSVLGLLLVVDKTLSDVVYTSPPPFGGNCWSSNQQLNFWELGLLQSGQNLTEKRIYNLCGNTETQIGVRSSPDSFDFVGGDMPLVIVNPNVNLLCGETGESINNCRFTKGEFQIAAFNPEGLLPPGSIPDVSNLFVSGFTFTGFGGNASSSAHITIPGQDIVFSDCIWMDNNASNPSDAAFGLTYMSSNDDVDGTRTPWASVTVKESLFENLHVGIAVINVNNRFGSGLTDVDFGRIDMSIEDCTFRANTANAVGNNIPLSIVDFAFNTTGSVESCCFYNNTAAGAMIAWYSDDQTVTGTRNFGRDNMAMLTDDAGNICDVAIFSDVDLLREGNRTCRSFGASVCESPFFTDMPSSSPTVSSAPSSMPAPNATSQPTPTPSSAFSMESRLKAIVLHAVWATVVVLTI